MLFPTLDFALFFIAVAVILALIGGLWELKKIFLVAASYVFYACWNWHFCFLLLFSTTVSYSVGLFLPEEDSPRLRKWMVGGGIAVQLLVLAFFKYYDFFATSLNKVTRDIGWGEPVPLIEILLPVAISFFTFHGISYIVDVYRGKVTRCRRFTDMMLYMSFFPQLVAGPQAIWERSLSTRFLLIPPVFPRWIWYSPFMGSPFRYFVIFLVIRTLP
ncbi:peptidoglycan O-acetyltransferase [Komagataeibacter europaeus]|uniref:Peptidoglycan O-acetyltransferase n=1 Tax=Komagataeibacter europaeus TaxID=33995 RepID=A0A0M0EDE6_KOMEU|nr:hypothetical protein [Komagataeibacter europaeus]KON63265.1 peptidoglycan O-acetyltransferase [Komagataeibacter europaeus]